MTRDRFMMDIFKRTASFSYTKYLEMKGSLLVDIHVPESWIGQELHLQERILFNQMKQIINRYYLSLMSHSLLVDMNDLAVNIISPHAHSMAIYTEIFKYLRLKLLSSDVKIVEYTAILLDFFVKNSLDYKVHLFIGRRKLMKTLSIIARRQLSIRGKCVTIPQHLSNKFSRRFPTLSTSHDDIGLSASVG